MSEADSDGTEVRNPEDRGHWMWLQPVHRHIRIYHGGTLLADTGHALRVLEFGHAVLPPALYVPPGAVRCPLRPSDAAHTYCPLKGTARYHDLAGTGERAAVGAIAWSYDEPIEAAARLAGLIAFRPERVTYVDAPP